jgi:hypothetical protein
MSFNFQFMEVPARRPGVAREKFITVANLVVLEIHADI